MPARLTSGVCADTSTVASTPKARAASATPRPWLPAEAAITRWLPSVPPRLERQRRDARRGAAQLERPRPLQVLELEPDVGAGAPAERGRGDERRHPGQATDALRRPRRR